MGVPSFYKWIFEHYHDYILSNKCQYGKPTHLYLDMNCGIHPAVKQKPMTLEEMPQAVINYLDNIVEIVRPSKMVYIAIDGVAPRAKMNQQRKRRYKNIKEKNTINQIKRKYMIPVDKESIDFNMISPGTKFIQDISTSLKKFIKKKIKTKGSPWYKLEVILSDANVPGEGAHKIMNHIRTKLNPNDMDIVTVYGLDADLIFLCMANNLPKMTLFRENIQFGKNKPTSKNKDGIEEYVFLSIDNLRDKLLSILDCNTTIDEIDNRKIFTDKLAARMDSHHIYDKNINKNKKSDDSRLIADYLVMCFFLGNDFLPPLPSLKIRNGGLEQVIRAYKLMQTHKLEDHYLVSINSKTSQFQINYENLYTFLSYLVKIEDESLKRETYGRYGRIKRFTTSTEYKMATNFDRECMELEMVELISKDLKLGTTTSNWKHVYYDHYFNFSPDSYGKNKEFRQNIDRVVKSYMNGIEWVLSYYYQDCIDWEWAYHHDEAPCVSDIIKFVKKMVNQNDNESFKIIPNNPATPFEQLLMIFPPQSAELLPLALSELMIDPESPIISNYPVEFNCELSGKRYLWECIPKLPKVDYLTIKKIVQRHLRYLTPEEQERNKNKNKTRFKIKNPNKS